MCSITRAEIPCSFALPCSCPDDLEWAELQAYGDMPVGALCYKPEGSGFDSRWVIEFYSVYLILPVALVPEV
jgi:hypothetical protein